MRSLVVWVTLMASALAHSADFSVIRSYVYPLVILRAGADGKPIHVGSGSGVVIKQGYVLSGQHVLPSIAGDRLLVGTPDRVMGAFVTKQSVSTDLVLLHVPGAKCPCASLATLTNYVDQEAWTVGFPLYSTYGVQFVTTGLVQAEANDRLVTTTNAAPGSSGGGVFVRQGKDFRLAGIVVEIATSPMGVPGLNLVQEYGWMSFSIPVRTIREFLKGTPAE